MLCYVFVHSCNKAPLTLITAGMSLENLILFILSEKIVQHDAKFTYGEYPMINDDGEAEDGYDLLDFSQLHPDEGKLTMFSTRCSRDIHEKYEGWLAQGHCCKASLTIVLNPTNRPYYEIRRQIESELV